MNILLDDLAKAFGRETLPLREWLGIVEAGLTGLTVGVIPPALDQVLIGAIDRTRNPELKLAIILGLNETVFPAPPKSGALLSEADRDELRALGAQAGPTRMQQLGREQFLAYIACTRARARLALSWSERDADDEPRNASPFVARVKKLFPGLEAEKFPGSDWRTAEHPCELAGRMVEAHRARAWPPRLNTVLTRPEFTLLREQMRLAAAPETGSVADLTERLYGPALKTSVSRLEDHAACAFKFFRAFRAGGRGAVDFRAGREGARQFSARGAGAVSRGIAGGGQAVARPDAGGGAG